MAHIWRALMRSVTAAMTVTAIAAAPVAAAQVKTIDPNAGIDADLQGPPGSSPAQHYPDQTVTVPQAPTASPSTGAPQSTAPYGTGAPDPTAATQAADTYHRDDLIAASEGVFGKGAEGLASIIEKILSEQGEPNAYIAGREASGAFVVGLRYGSGVMTHKVEGQRPVYWTGPSVGFDVGGDANKVFVLVYNLYDTQELYTRFPAAEGRLYFVGGFAATYLRKGNVVLIPVRLGVGWRAGVNVGYMKFSETSKWLPF